jgi:hypothetical protein
MHFRWERTLRGRDYTELSQELQSLVAGGVPLKHRRKLWAARFDSGAFPRADPAGAEAPGDFDVGDFDAQIALDVPRTRPESLGQAERAALRRILSAFATQDPSTGYCQGMNNIAAVFVIVGFDEAEAVQGLSSLLRRCCPNYHDAGLSGWHRDAAVLRTLARRMLPEGTCSRLDALGVPMDVLASDHFLTLASRSWPFQATVQLWDLLFLQGSPALFASFLALLELFLPSKEEADSALEHPVELFRAATLRGLREDLPAVLQRMTELIPKIPESLLESLRAEAEEAKVSA